MMSFLGWVILIYINDTLIIEISNLIATVKKFVCNFFKFNLLLFHLVLA